MVIFSKAESCCIEVSSKLNIMGLGMLTVLLFPNLIEMKF